MRIFITGNAGSGKTTLARTLGERLGLRVYGLDTIVWQAGWQKTPLDVRAQKELELAAQPSWVIEGVSSRVAKEADFIVFLDVPRWLCLWRACKRNLPYLFRSRPGLPENCPEWRIFPQLLKIIWQFPVRVRPKILRILERQMGVRVRHPEPAEAAVERFLCP